MNITPRVRSSIVALMAAIALAWGSFTEHATAFTDVTTFNVAVAVDVRCSIAAAAVNFGSSYMSGQVDPLDAQGTLIVSCDEQGRRVRVRLGQGLYPAPGSTNNNPLRRMASGSNRLNYNLYEDAARTVVWDNRTSGVLLPRTFPYVAIVYGRVFGSQNVPPGHYSDTVVATVVF